MSANTSVTPDTQALLLLLSRFGQPKGVHTPLNFKEYDRLAIWLQGQKMRPADLLRPEGKDRLESAPRGLDIVRINSLLSRGAALGFAVEEWTARGLWIIGRGDTDYPKSLKQKLRRESPPLLFGAGQKAGLLSGGIAVVGSRAADASALAFTRMLAKRCASIEFNVVSGAARGVDSEAMISAITEGGKAVGILPGDLERTSLEKRYRQALEDGQLTLLSPYDPKSRFTVGSAMDRNKIIYALSDFSVVVSSDYDKGGTWAGAIENLSARWVPLFVRQEPGCLEGNQRLIERGGIPLMSNAVSGGGNFRQWLTEQAHTHWMKTENGGNNQQAELLV